MFTKGLTAIHLSKVAYKPNEGVSCFLTFYLFVYLIYTLIAFPSFYVTVLVCSELISVFFGFFCSV